MTDPTPQPLPRRTPENATAFEREQLRFFLSGEDIPRALSEVNPSLAWLPVLSEMQLIKGDAALIAWVERNFTDEASIREVVANIRFFSPDTAKFIQYRLDEQTAHLSPLLVKCWSLIIRHIRSARRGVAGNEWFDVISHIRRGDFSVGVLERLANALRPELKIAKRLLCIDAGETPPELPTDLMSIDYEIDDGVSSDDLLAAWPVNAVPDKDEALLLQLATAVNAALADATEAGVESNERYGTSDSDVPSVAGHRQNEYHSGFQAIVRVTAEIWTRLASKTPARAIAIAESWRDSPFRLMRRMAMFALCNPAVPAQVGAEMLMDLPLGELFLTGSSHEAYQLICSRWNDFPDGKQQKILRRIRSGPPRALFREGADHRRLIDRSRYDFLSAMSADGINIGPESERLLARIQARWPRWHPKPAERIGFQVWHESGTRGPGGDTTGFDGVTDDELIARAREIASTAEFRDGNAWQGLCMSDPDRAVRGLDAAAAGGDWSATHWDTLLWSRAKYEDPHSERRIAKLLLQSPQAVFQNAAPAASFWLWARTKSLSDTILWRLWDRIADVTFIEALSPADE